MTQDAARDAQTRMWTVGDYPTIARHLLPISEAAVAALDIGPGDRVLDVAVGDGNAAVLAARRGATVTGIDLTPAQIDRARERCAAEGVDVELRIGDAQALDVPDADFDVVVSVMGVIFAPDPLAAAREMARACRPGGRIAMTAWSRSGWALAWRAKAAELMPAPPPGPQPDDWGEPQEVTRRMAAAGLDAVVERRDFVWHFPSPEAAFETFVTSAGPYVMFMETMREQGTADRARSAMLDAMQETNLATDGTCELPAAYLLVTAAR